MTGATILPHQVNQFSLSRLAWQRRGRLCGLGGANNSRAGQPEGSQQLINKGMRIPVHRLSCIPQNPPLALGKYEKNEHLHVLKTINYAVNV
jgi:hypothetical protein